MNDIKQFTAEPLDPTTNAEDLMGDTSGKSGITTNRGGSTETATNGNRSTDFQPGGTLPQTQPMQSTPHLANSDQNPNTHQELPDQVITRAVDTATEPNEFDADLSHSPKIPLVRNPQSANQGKISLSGDPDIQNYQYTPVPPPNYSDELSAMGTNPDPDSDDDIDALAASVGLYDNIDSEIPEELDIAGQINQDEEDLRYT